MQNSVYNILMEQIKIEKEKKNPERAVIIVPPGTIQMMEDIKRRARERESFIAWNNMK